MPHFLPILDLPAHKLFGLTDLPLRSSLRMFSHTSLSPPGRVRPATVTTLAGPYFDMSLSYPSRAPAALISNDITLP